MWPTHPGPGRRRVNGDPARSRPAAEKEAGPRRDRPIPAREDSGLDAVVRERRACRRTRPMAALGAAGTLSVFISARVARPRRLSARCPSDQARKRGYGRRQPPSAGFRDSFTRLFRSRRRAGRFALEGPRGRRGARGSIPCRAATSRQRATWLLFGRVTWAGGGLLNVVRWARSGRRDLLGSGVGGGDADEDGGPGTKRSPVLSELG
jgi:hypothetical protein